MRLRVQAPATTANLSCGFDVLGLALDLFFWVEVEVFEERLFLLTHQGEGEGEIPEDENNLFFKAVGRTWERLGFEGMGLKVKAQNAIPIARGLGSSAACIAAGVTVANTLSGGKLTLEEMLEVALLLEGHPDNIVPAFLGGFTIALLKEGKVLYRKIPFLSSLHLYALVPDYSLSTELMRRALPASYSREDVVFSLQRLAFLLGSVFEQSVEGFLQALEDRIHEPYRGKYVMGFEEVKSYVRERGLGSAAISGSGPTILLFLTQPLRDSEAREIQETFSHLGATVSVREVHPQEKGVEVEVL
ncbi:MAG: homoserine kinase [Candidatus Caldatribacteriaceae bacterium]